MKDKGRLVLFSGPAGVGKDTLLEILFQKRPELQRSISVTTRRKRECETDGVDYYFVSNDDFQRMIASGNILEYTKYGANFYGTPKKPVDNWLEEGKTVILKIEVNGASNIKKIYNDSISVFIMPPSVEELEKRLRSRGTEDEDDIRGRMEIAVSEIAHSRYYDHVVINDDIDTAAEDVLAILDKYNSEV